jgi:hypothetical protein
MGLVIFVMKTINAQSTGFPAESERYLIFLDHPDLYPGQERTLLGYQANNTAAPSH